MSDFQWNQFMAFAARFAKTVDLEAEEYTYKLALAERLRVARKAFLNHDQGWFEQLRGALASANLIDQYTMMSFTALGRTEPEILRGVIEYVWAGEPDVGRLNKFGEALGPYNPERFTNGSVATLGAVLLLGRDPEQFPPYRARAVKKFLKLVGWEDRGTNGLPALRYEILLDALDEILRLAPEHGLQLRDRLDAQGLLWTVMNVDPTSEWSVADSVALREWRGDKVENDSIEARLFGPYPATEAAARAIIDAGLLLQSSPFGGGEPTWTLKNAQEIFQRVIVNADIGTGTFLGKLELQLSGASAGVIRLAAELVALQTLPLSNLTAATRRGRIKTVLSWLGEETSLPKVIDEGLGAGGAFHGGTGFNMYQWKHLGWLASLIVAIRQQGITPDQLLEDPEQLLQVTQSLDEDVQAIRYAFEYLVWPSFAEPVVNRGHRVRIRNAFAPVIGGGTGNTDIDIARDLHQIQSVMTERDGHRIEWYDEPYSFEWMGHKTGGQRAWLVRQNQGGIAMMDQWLAEEFVSTRAQHLGSPAPGSSFEEVQSAVNSGYQHIDYSERKVRAFEYFRFLSQMNVDDLVLTPFGDKLYLGVVTGEAEYVDDETSRLRREVVWRKQPISNVDLPAPLPRLLEEQGSVVDLTDGLSVIGAWYTEDDNAEDGTAEPEPIVQPQAAVVPQLREATAELAGRLHVEQKHLQEIVRLLQTRQQIVFYGPPGTGKTYLAGKIARFLAGEEHGDHVKTVQFHPSYAYEDFFEGYRPAKTEGENVGFSLEPGPLRRIAAEASLDGNRDKPYFLIIDEMNRGNLAKIFGELYFLLEYRDQGINLQYNPQQTFVLPPNLFIIGTMNTSDRSIAMVDAAIRRRFAFVELHPQDGMISGLLERFLTANGKPSLRADLLNALNNEIEATNRDLMIGPSYFMKPHAETDEGLEEIWKYELLPLLEEQYFGRLSRDKVREKFGLGAMRKKAGLDMGPVDISLVAGPTQSGPADGAQSDELEQLFTETDEAEA
ncbi:McrB family protein [Arthrobacter sp. CJ23]|uniref:McrB family protein n=1 Tax=Arthrobacter sp. CJ23 TaxID=2972479 RepID=UPI00215BE675|nr:AAA family ATPase [Arthrobacter sp. CJ23]UVJ40569.1 AAA family ATPase [Arthrobacter sp. CJ23]